MRWARMLAAVLGGLLALWLLRGSTDAGQGFEAIVRVQQHHTWDARGLLFVELRFPDGGAVTISGDTDVPVMRWLTAREGRVMLAMKPYELEKLSR